MINKIIQRIVPITAITLLTGFFRYAVTPEIRPITNNIIPIQLSQPNNGTKPKRTNTKPTIAKTNAPIKSS